jgi:hypothetical protein
MVPARLNWAEDAKIKESESKCGNLMLMCVEMLFNKVET